MKAGGPIRQGGAGRPVGFLGWLGRQVGFVRKAVKTEVGGPGVIYRADSVEEMPHPDDPKLKLRRTVIDEVVEKKGKRDGETK